MTHKAQHPEHYCAGGIECISAIRASLVMLISAIAKEFAQVHLALREKTRGSLAGFTQGQGLPGVDD